LFVALQREKDGALQCSGVSLIIRLLLCKPVPWEELFFAVRHEGGKDKSVALWKSFVLYFLLKNTILALAGTKKTFKN